MDLKSLIEKYSVAGPRYTSYPTAPQFQESIGADAYRTVLKGLDEKEPVSIYTHLPFCEALCYYCGCNILVTSDHSRSAPYVRAVLKEAKLVKETIGHAVSFSQMAWGGGTPTYLPSEEMTELYLGLTEYFSPTADAEIGIEIDPRVTSFEQLACLRKLGFNRVSLGVQDFDPEVQKVVNRMQPASATNEMLIECRRLGFRGINFDLIYGLPLQTLASFEKTLDQVIEMRPDRIALFNYAHLPSLRPHQKILENHRMPTPEERVAIFASAYHRLLSAGYGTVGMDHFALKEDELFQSMEKRTLYRNFQGYTVQSSQQLLGLGASAIGEVGSHYFQNVREVKPYQDQVERGEFAVFRGVKRTREDEIRKWVIQSIMCRFVLDPSEFESTWGESLDNHFPSELKRLPPFLEDGIIEKNGDSYHVTDLGRLFIRNVAMEFDAYLKPGAGSYSKTV